MSRSASGARVGLLLQLRFVLHKGRRRLESKDLYDHERPVPLAGGRPGLWPRPSVRVAGRPAGPDLGGPRIGPPTPKYRSRCVSRPARGGRGVPGGSRRSGGTGLGTTGAETWPGAGVSGVRETSGRRTGPRRGYLVESGRTRGGDLDRGEGLEAGVSD